MNSITVNQLEFDSYYYQVRNMNTKFYKTYSIQNIFEYLQNSHLFQHLSIGPEFCKDCQESHTLKGFSISPCHNCLQFIDIINKHSIGNKKINIFDKCSCIEHSYLNKNSTTQNLKIKKIEESIKSLEENGISNEMCSKECCIFSKLHNCDFFKNLLNKNKNSPFIINESDDEYDQDYPDAFPNCYCDGCLNLIEDIEYKIDIEDGDNIKTYCCFPCVPSNLIFKNNSLPKPPAIFKDDGFIESKTCDDEDEDEDIGDNVVYQPAFTRRPIVIQ